MAGVPRRAWIWPRAENAARVERAKGEAAGDRNRYQAGGRGRTVAELPVAVSAPAVGCPSRREAAAVNRTRDNGAEAQPAGDGQGCRGRCGGAGAELTVVVVAPAVGCAGAREPTRVGFLDRPVCAVAHEEAAARGDGAKAETPRDRDRCQAGCRGKRAVPELPVVIVAPAVGRPGAGEPAGVTAVGGDGGEAQAPGDSNRNRAVRGRPVAELAVVVGAPAVDRARARECAGVAVAHAEARDGGERGRSARVLAGGSYHGSYQAAEDCDRSSRRHTHPRSVNDSQRPRDVDAPLAVVRISPGLTEVVC